MKLTKILIVTPDFYPTNGGYANAVTNFVRHLLKQNKTLIHVVTLTPLNNRDEITAQNLKVIRFKRLKMFKGSIIIDQIRLGFFLRKMIRKNDFDFILFETFENPIAIRIVLIGATNILRKIAIRIHGCTETEVFKYYRKLGYYKLQYFFLRQVGRIVPNVLSTTKFYIDFFIQEILGGNVFDSFKNYCVLSNFIWDDAITKSKSDLQNSGYKLLALGRMDEIGYNQKNFELIAFAVWIIKEINPKIYNNLKIYLVGSGERKRSFDKLIHRLNIHDRFVLFESMPNYEIRKLQANVNGVILVSRYEGQSMFALETLSVGTPLIVSKNTGVSELVDDGINGFKIDANDPYSLADAIIKICNTFSESMKEASIQKFTDNFSGDILIEKFYRYIEICLSSQK